MKYLNFDGLSHFLSKLRGVFAVVGHTHTKSEITDYVVDSTMSSTSTNPVQNKVVNTALSGKVSTSRKINGKALTADITLSASDVGADASGTAATKANEALASAKMYADEKVANLVDSAPDTLNTLNELATAIQEHQDVTDALDAAITKKVDKVEGKGLSTNDYTDEDKAKLVALEAEVEKKAEGVDWNENDSTSPAYVKNRTHWVEEDIIVVPETTITITDKICRCDYFPLIPGNKYIVTWMNAEYECIAYEYEPPAVAGTYGIGINFNTAEGADKYPFSIASAPDGSAAQIAALVDDGDYTFSIRMVEDTVHQLDPKFIPFATDDEILSLMASIDALPVLTDENDTIYTDEADNILLI